MYFMTSKCDFTDINYFQIKNFIYLLIDVSLKVRHAFDIFFTFSVNSKILFLITGCWMPSESRVLEILNCILNVSNTFLK